MTPVTYTYVYACCVFCYYCWYDSRLEPAKSKIKGCLNIHPWVKVIKVTYPGVCLNSAVALLSTIKSHHTKVMSIMANDYSCPVLFGKYHVKVHFPFNGKL